MAENVAWKDDDASFFIRDKTAAESNLLGTTPENIKRSPSFTGYVETIPPGPVLEEPDQSAFYLDDNVTHEAPPTPTSKVQLDLKAVRDSEAIADNLKDEICCVLQENNVSMMELLNKPSDEVDFLFPNATAKAAVETFCQLEKWKRDQLPTEILRLCNAAKAGNLDFVKEITSNANIPPLGRKLLVDCRDESNHNRTPLMHACRHGHLAIVGYLVKAQNADIYARDSHKLQSMAIHFAAQGGYVEIVRFLAGIDPKLVEAKNKHGDSPLNMAAVGGKLAACECLVKEKKANIEHRGQYGMTPLLCAAEKGHVHVVRFLVESGADLIAKDEKNNDMGIHWGARFGHLDTVAYFLDCRPSLIEAINGLGRTPLHQAAIGGHLTVVKFLVKKGANLMAMSNYEDLISSPIHLAAYFGHDQVVAFLLDSNPELLEIENKDEKTPYMLAKEEKRTAMMELLAKRGAITTPKKQ